MRLVSLTVKDFRSITTAYKLHLGASTVLIGPNNEGKSNILRAIVIGLEVLRRGRRLIRSTGLQRSAPRIASGTFAIPPYALQELYSWETDFPIGRRNRKPQGNSEFVLEFELDAAEVEEFRHEIRSNLNGTLPIRVAIGREAPSVSVVKKGPGGKALTAKSALIAEFVRDKIALQYIPTVRTAESSREVVDEMLAVELMTIERAPEYGEALSQIAMLQEPILARISDTIKSTLVKFLPNIKDVQVRIAAEARIQALRRSSEIIINDGTPTELRFKGDGVQSLAALALLRHSADRLSSGKHIIVAVEEPESHLHPNAIQGLRAVLHGLAERQQVVITTHCPLFVDRSRVAANILVNNNRARSAKNIAEIREILGVRASDNLRHAELVLLVEGEEDRMALVALLKHHSPILGRAIQENTIALESLGGGSNVSYKVSLIHEALCACHCFLDNDKSGREGFEKARVQGLLREADVTFCICQGMPDSEIEDMYDVEMYETMILNKYRVSLKDAKFKSNRKWSDRMREVFQHQGQLWNDRVEGEVKRWVAELVRANPEAALNPPKRSAFDALAVVLERRLAEAKTP